MRGEDRVWLFNIGSPLRPHHTSSRSSLITLLHACFVAIHLHLSSMFIPDSRIYPTICPSHVLPIQYFLNSSSIGYFISLTHSVSSRYAHASVSSPPVCSLILHWPVHLWGLRISCPVLLVIIYLESPVATKVPAELYQPNSRAAFNRHTPVLHLVLYGAPHLRPSNRQSHFNVIHLRPLRSPILSVLSHTLSHQSLISLYDAFVHCNSEPPCSFPLMGVAPIYLGFRPIVV